MKQRRRKLDGGKTAPWIATAFFCLALMGCEQRMANQPRYDTYEASTFFDDQLSVRLPVSGTIPRGHLKDDTLLHHGRTAEGDDAPYVDVFPFEIKAEDLARGKQRYDIFCSVCHGYTGYGNGKIVERGYLQPPSFHTDNSRGLALRGTTQSLREVPVGYIYNVIANGYNGMPDYRAELKVEDRWRVVAYVRLLQAREEGLKQSNAEKVGLHKQTQPLGIGQGGAR